VRSFQNGQGGPKAAAKELVEKAAATATAAAKTAAKTAKSAVVPKAAQAAAAAAAAASNAQDATDITQEIYTDGSSLSNGRVGASAGYGVYFGPGDERYDESSRRAVWWLHGGWLTFVYQECL
jgi:ribonuclease HI